MKATEQYFPVVPFIMLYNVILTFESVDEILMCRPFKWKLLSVFGGKGLISPVVLKNLCSPLSSPESCDYKELLCMVQILGRAEGYKTKKRIWISTKNKKNKKKECSPLNPTLNSNTNTELFTFMWVTRTRWQLHSSLCGLSQWMKPLFFSTGIKALPKYDLEMLTFCHSFTRGNLKIDCPIWALILLLTLISFVM